ncbi:metal ABC transporter permease [Tenacibaculum maritimum]|uniref:ABC-type Mn2+/Zn2+ transport systems, permease components n=1 Tax=Tenacibaculum maritimum NCIMB 2154 TaxID=1349785 RepID=A0A2H1EE46_9FLAO|nr:metal ABC transporter permease [Tenacibaculum maritimum]MCD9563261.1 metal ABC transporter permease [Tenacibaculum maritimum]MCD9566078.1 metal ABC transporter permease [Tenacibaculum maritimum]MCD9578435.1 metal ABC transporter permease [Tenacibaculum maritimum]MCD9581523.1 metal ABC transporter permease [Tenacibaculum maritimum]MCD9584246.1 metal ABC transporter permease [Tenacibaculum maritimum]
MSFTEYFELLLNDYTLRTISLGTAVLGAICGMLGSFAVLRKQSLLGDAISHAALPGIAIAFLITGTKETNVLLVGALISGLIGAFWIRGITRNTHLKSDTALGLILSIFFGFGMLLLTYIQKQPNANQSGLDKFLFGQAATLLARDVWFMALVTLICLFTILLFWKEFKILLFDADYAKTLGFNTKVIDVLITSFIVLAIVLGLQTVGVVLMSAMLLAPAAAARQWTNSLGVMVILAAIFGASSGVLGTAISASQNNLSTGPVIVLVAAVFVVFSFVFSPSRGLLFRQIRFIQNRKDLQLHKTLAFMFEIAKNHENISHPHTIKILNNFHGFTRKSLSKLEHKEYISIDGQMWAMTEKGYHFAANLYNQQEDKDD